MLHTVRQARDSPETGLAGVQHTHKDHHPSLDCPFPMARLSHFIMFILKLQGALSVRAPEADPFTVSFYKLDQKTNSHVRTWKEMYQTASDNLMGHQRENA